MKRYLNLVVLLLFFSVTLFSVMPAVANGFDLQVEINLATPGSIISIPSGTYSGNFIVTKSLTLEAAASGEVLLTRPWTENDLKKGSESPAYPEDMPIITIYPEDDVEIEVNLEGLTFAQATSDDIEAEYTTIAVLAGSGVNLSMTDCVISEDMGDFYAPVVVTTWDDVFESALGNVELDLPFGIRNGNEDDSPAMPSSLTMTGCKLSNYSLAGTVLLGEGVTGTFESNDFFTDLPDKMKDKDADMAMSSLTEIGLSALSGSLFGVEDAIERLLDNGARIGLLIANSRDDRVTLRGNSFVNNLAGVAAIKGGLTYSYDDSPLNEADTDSSFLNQQAVEAGQGLSIEGDTNKFEGNLIGVAALGGLDVTLALVIEDDSYGDTSNYLLIPNLKSTDLYIGEPMPLFLQDATFTNNLIGTLIAGKVQATVDSNLYIGDPEGEEDIVMPPLAGLVGLGDLSDSFVTDNTFDNIPGVSLLFGLQKVNISDTLDAIIPLLGSDAESEDEYIINQQGILNISGNTVKGYILEDLEEAPSLETVMSQAMALGQSSMNGGPLAVLSPSSSLLDELPPYLAGVVLLDGAQNIVIDSNNISGTFLGIAGIDTGVIEGIQSVDITGNNVYGNIAGLTMVGAAGVLVPIVEDMYDSEVMSEDNALVLGDLSGNFFNGNMIGMISGLAVEGEINDNFFNDNMVLGMAHIGIGDWLFSAGLADSISGDIGEILYELSDIISGDISPKLYIHNNDIRNNGTDTESMPAFMNEPLGDVTPDMMLRGGVLAIDAANENFKLSRNNIAGNGNYGVLATGRATEELPLKDAETTEVISSDEEAYWLDATNNYWGSEDGPGSYVGSGDVTFGEDFLFEDPASGTLADGSGDGICGIVLEIDDVYYPYSMTPATNYVRPTNTIMFRDASPTEFEVNPAPPAPPASSGGGTCSVGIFPGSLAMLLIPLALIVFKK